MNIRWLLIGTAVLVASAAAALADDWPQWRGPDRTDISRETGLLKEWPKGGPKLLWKCDKAGLGFSGFAVVGDVLYTMGARNEEEYAIALSVKDGSQLWAAKLGPIFTFKGNNWGDSPRATPTVDGDRVYCLGGQGELVCLKRDKGEVVWRKNLVKDFKGQIMVHAKESYPTGWGYCESPLVDGDQLVCCPGGPDGWMISLDKLTGAVKWRTTELPDQATDSSVVVATIGGMRQYVNSTYKGNTDGGGLAGVDAKTGKVLWYAKIGKQYDIYAVSPTPVVKDNLVYATAADGYGGGGCNLLRITKDAAGKFSAEDLYNDKTRKLVQNEHGGVVLVDGHIYGYGYPRGWLCQEVMTGKVVWSERRVLDGKGGSLTYADGNLYLLSDEGEAVLLRPTPEGWQEKGRFNLPELSKTSQTRTTHRSARVWTHPVVANGRLFLRDQELIYCYAVR